MVRTFPQNFVVKHLLSYLGPSPVKKARVAHTAKAPAFVNLVTVDFFIANDAIFLNWSFPDFKHMFRRNLLPSSSVATNKLWNLVFLTDYFWVWKDPSKVLFHLFEISLISASLHLKLHWLHWFYFYNRRAAVQQISTNVHKTFVACHKWELPNTSDAYGKCDLIWLIALHSREYDLVWFHLSSTF